MKVYEKVYEYYINQIRNGGLEIGHKMPSIRECEKSLDVSKTSVETAYQQLAADGYIYSVEKVGFFVSEMAKRNHLEDKAATNSKRSEDRIIKYDFATIGEDKLVSCLDLWRRYMKSALRQEDRLLSYADNQGEEDLREEIVKYVRRTRNIICTKEDVVIGAGFQNLLQILIALVPGERTISFPTKDFIEGATTFKNAGFEVAYRNKESHVIYVAPSYMTKWGEVMTMKRRRELINHAINNNHLIIEDDYQNDFVFSTKATPSLYALTGGENTAFLGSFSRLLLPSVRISYLILPKGVREKYQGIKPYYNQTASKAEQIALSQFLRDGHLRRHLKKIKRLYGEKRQSLQQCVEKKFGDNTEILFGDSGMEMGILIREPNVKERLEKSSVNVTILQKEKDDVLILLSCSKISEEDIEKGIEELQKSISKE